MQASSLEAGAFVSAIDCVPLHRDMSRAQLEDRLGVRLLLRSTHGLTPTEAGQSFYERAKRSLEEADEADLAARGAAATLSGRLRISAAVTFAQLHIVPKLPPIDLWAVFPSGRRASAKARAFISFIQGQLATLSLPSSESNAAIEL